MSLAAALKPKTGGLGGGWLSMAPEVDEEPAPSTSSHLVPSLPSPRAGSSSSISATACPTHASNMAPNASFTPQQRARTAPTAPPRRILPRTNALFKVGDSSQLATPSSPVPESPYSRGSDFDSPPPFDVRASFAPMPRWGGGQAASDNNGGVTSIEKAEPPGLLSNGMDSQEIVEEAAEDEAADTKLTDDNKGIHYAGIQWKGKTAHAVELEMEALGDRTVMSYAPDAVYLASRLEGLKRNLDVGGDRLKRWAWEDYEDEVAEEGSEAAAREEADTKEELVMPALEQQVADSTMSSPSVSEGITPSDEAMEDPMQATSAVNAEDAQKGMQDGGDIPRITVDASAKAAALDARVEIRTLRRPDLEQVRELHCYHGASEKVDKETYTTSAGFLLRLLVDEHHVCLVAVAKPLPEPPSLPSRFSPGAPPPSLDMPPSKSPFLVAGQRSHLASRRCVPPLASKLAVVSHPGNLLAEATAPRSFGAGAESSSSMDSDGDEEDERGSRQQESLFDAAKAASTFMTGESSPEVIAEEDEEAVLVDAEEEGGELDLHTGPPTSPDLRNVLAGPTHDVAPPRAVRVMGAPPLNGLPRDAETILGVASARIKVVQRSEGDDMFGKTDSLDSSWPGLDPKGEKSMVTREAHIITLAVVPGERGQGLGARLLDHLLDECKRRTAGPRIHLASGSTSIEEMDTAPRVHENAPMRTFLEVHPINTAAIDLYHSRHFHRVEGPKGIVKHYYRGDPRIPDAVRVRVGGADAIRLERFDFK